MIPQLHPGYCDSGEPGHLESNRCQCALHVRNQEEMVHLKNKWENEKLRICDLEGSRVSLQQEIEDSG